MTDAQARPPVQADLALTSRQWGVVNQQLDELAQAHRWHSGMPVLLLERCWLRMSIVTAADLVLKVVPDCSRELPELVRYRQLLAEGRPSWQAQQLCWHEFGSVACQQALRRFWAAQEQGNHGWTLDQYLNLLRQYQRRFEQGQPRPVPLLMLARSWSFGSDEPHQLCWLKTAMRQTCT